MSVLSHFILRWKPRCKASPKNQIIADLGFLITAITWVEALVVYRQHCIKEAVQNKVNEVLQERVIQSKPMGGTDRDSADGKLYGEGCSVHESQFLWTVSEDQEETASMLL